jgi:hypothetical protein
MAEQTRDATRATFLTLPTEIRKLILTEVLASHACSNFLPLDFLDLDFRLHTAILLTCTQIYSEASDVLYNQIVHLDIRRASTAIGGCRDYSLRAVYLGRAFDVESIPAAILQRPTRLNIQLRTHPQRTGSNEELKGTQLLFSKLARLVDRTPQWQHIRLRTVTHQGAPVSGTIPGLRPGLWTGWPPAPLELVRNRRSVQCYDVVDELRAKRLVDLMTSSEHSPLTEMDETFAQLHQLCDLLSPPEINATKYRANEGGFRHIRAQQQAADLHQDLMAGCGEHRASARYQDFLMAKDEIVGEMKEFFNKRKEENKDSQEQWCRESPAAIEEKFRALESRR